MNARKPVPYWTTHVKPLKDEALFWHAIWKSCDSPTTGVVAQIRRATRSKYHRAIRFFRQHENLARFSRMGEEFLLQDRTDFWSEVRRMRGNDAPAPSMVDDNDTEAEIAQCFGRKYESLYTSVRYDQEGMEELRGEIDASASHHADNSCLSHMLTVHDLALAVKCLKQGKHDGHVGFYSDHLRLAPQRFLSGLALTLNALLVHGVVPDEMRLSTVSPIPKNKRKSVNDSDNYRAIALSSIVGKMLDRILIKKCPELSLTSDLQFGFKAGHSTTQCSFVAREVIEYYHNRETDVYVTLLDASKAFDRVEYVALFRKLTLKGVCPIVTRFLLGLYTCQQIRVRWGGVHTEPFATTNGVKQGGVLSPLLFSLYLEPLLQQLISSGYGCWVGSTYCGALAYADDVVLLAPTVHALKEQLEICARYAQEYKVLFNASKSKLIPLRRNHASHHAPPVVHLMGDPIECVNQDKHLGTVIGCTTNDGIMDAAIKDFNCRVGMLRAHFKWLPPDCLYSLFKTFCMPLYGSVLWDFSHRSVERFYTAWRKGVRSLLRLHPRTHCALLAPICSDFEVETQLMSRVVKFIRSLGRSCNRLVRVCLSLAMAGSRSAVSRSITIASAISRKPRQVLIETRCPPIFLFPRNDVHDQEAGLIRDMLLFRSQLFLDAYFDPHHDNILQDIEFLLQQLLTG